MSTIAIDSRDSRNPVAKALNADFLDPKQSNPKKYTKTSRSQIEETNQGFSNPNIKGQTFATLEIRKNKTTRPNQINFLTIDKSKIITPDLAISSPRPLLQKKISEILQKIIESNAEIQTIHSQEPFSINLIENNEANAWIEPNNNRITLTIGLLKNIISKLEPYRQNWDAVAFIICHELSHAVYQKDPSLTIYEKFSTKYSNNDQEAFADRFALELMNRAGFSVRFAKLDLLGDVNSDQSEINAASTFGYSGMEYPSRINRNRKLKEEVISNYWSNYAEISKHPFLTQELAEIQEATKSELIFDPIIRNSVENKHSIETMIVECISQIESNNKDPKAIHEQIKNTKGLSDTSKEIIRRALFQIAFPQAAFTGRSQAEKQKEKEQKAKIKQLERFANITNPLLNVAETLVKEIPAFAIFTNPIHEDSKVSPFIAKIRNELSLRYRKLKSESRFHECKSTHQVLDRLITDLEAYIQKHKKLLGKNIVAGLSQDQIIKFLINSIRNELKKSIKDTPIKSESDLDKVFETYLNKITETLQRNPIFNPELKHALGLSIDEGYAGLAFELSSRIQNLIQESPNLNKADYEKLISILSQYNLKLGVTRFGLKIDISPDLIEVIEDKCRANDFASLSSFFEHLHIDKQIELVNKSQMFRESFLREQNIFDFYRSRQDIEGFDGALTAVVVKLARNLDPEVLLEECLKADERDLLNWYATLALSLRLNNHNKAGRINAEQLQACAENMNKLIAKTKGLTRENEARRFLASCASDILISQQGKQAITIDDIKNVFEIYPEFMAKMNFGLLMHLVSGKASSGELAKARVPFYLPSGTSRNDLRDLLLLCGSEKTSVVRDTLVNKLVRSKETSFIKPESVIGLNKDGDLVGWLRTTGADGKKSSTNKLGKIFGSLSSDYRAAAYEALDAVSPGFSSSVRPRPVSREKLNYVAGNLSKQDLKTLIQGGRIVDQFTYLKALIQKLREERSFDENSLVELAGICSNKTSLTMFRDPDADLPNMFESLQSDPIHKSITLTVYDCLFMNFFKQEGSKFLEKMNLEEALTWIDKFYNQASNYRDYVITKFLLPKINASANTETALKLFDRYQVRFKASKALLNFYNDRKKACNSFGTRLDFITKVFPEASIMRDFLLDELFDSFEFKLSDFQRNQSLYTGKNRQEERSRNRLEFGYLVRLFQAEPESKQALVSYILEDQSKQKSPRIQSLEKSLGYKLDELKELCVYKPFRDWLFTQLFAADDGLLSPKNQKTLDSLINDVFAEYFLVNINDNGNIVKLKQICKSILTKIFQSKNRDRKLNLIKQLSNALVTNKGKPSLNQLIAAFLQGYGVVGVKFGQMQASNSAFLRNFPDLAAELSQLKENADSPSYGILLRNLSCNRRLKPHQIRIKKRLNSASIKTAFDAELNIGGKRQAKILLVKRPEAGKYIIEEVDDLQQLIDSINPELKTLFALQTIPNYSRRIKTVLLEETDFRREIINRNRLNTLISSANSGLDGIEFYCPEIDSRLSDDQLLVMDKAEGESLENWIAKNPKTESFVVDAIRKNFQNQLISGFYHADPHSGNMRIRKDSNEKIRIGLIDFGLCGELGDDLKDIITKLIQGAKTGVLAKMISNPLLAKRFADSVKQGQRVSYTTYGRILSQVVNFLKHKKPLEFITNLDSIAGFETPESILRIFYAMAKLP